MEWPDVNAHGMFKTTEPPVTWLIWVRRFLFHNNEYGNSWKPGGWDISLDE